MRRYFFIIVSYIIFFANSVYADKSLFESIQRGTEEYTIATGYGENHRIPSSTKTLFGFNLVKFRYGKYTSPRTELAVEISGEKVISGNDNHCITVMGCYRRTFMVRGDSALSYDLCFGFARLSERIPELASKTNFTEHIGLVYQYATSPISALTVEFKICHVSNGGLEFPNIGLNSSVISVGYTWFD